MVRSEKLRGKHTSAGSVRNSSGYLTHREMCQSFLDGFALVYSLINRVLAAPPHPPKKESGVWAAADGRDGSVRRKCIECVNWEPGGRVFLIWWAARWLGGGAVVCRNLSLSQEGHSGRHALAGEQRIEESVIISRAAACGEGDGSRRKETSEGS